MLNPSPCTGTELGIDIADLLVNYLNQLGIEFVYGIPGGAIEPLYNALARSERNGGPRAITARHETGAVFMADGYARNAGKLGVCCTTTGPGATNAITGAAVAYENHTPLLIITAQTALEHFGKRAFQDSSDTGIDTTALFKHCTRYSSMISHADQFEIKLVRAVMTALGSHKGPVHLSIPPDILRHKTAINTPSYFLPALIKPPGTMDNDAVMRLLPELENSQKTVFILGSRCAEAMPCLLKIIAHLHCPVLTTPDGKGLIDPTHDLYHGVLGFGGHQSANDLLAEPAVDLVVAIGTSLSEWSSNGWDSNDLLHSRLVHIDDSEHHLPQSAMARLQIRGRLLAICQAIQRQLLINTTTETATKTDNRAANNLPSYQEQSYSAQQPGERIKPQWLMHQLTRLFPGDTRYVIDTGNCFSWAVHYLHPYCAYKNNQQVINGSSTFQTAMEFSSMGWAIGSAIGAAMAAPGPATVAITGDGSWLMSGQEITTAIQEQVPVVFIILNDSSLGMVKHGQRLAQAEPVGFDIPPVDFKAMAQAMGADAYRVETNRDLLLLDIEALLNKQRPCVIDVCIDAEQVPPMGVRMKVLQQDKAPPLTA